MNHILGVTVVSVCVLGACSSGDNLTFSPNNVSNTSNGANTQGGNGSADAYDVGGASAGSNATNLGALAGSPLGGASAGSNAANLGALAGSPLGGASAGATGSGASAGAVGVAMARSFIVGVGPTWKWYFGEGEPRAVPSPSAETVKDMVLGISESAQMVLAQSGWRAPVLGQVPPYFNDLVNVWPKPPVMDSPVAFEFVSYGINFFDQGTGAAQLTTPADADNDWQHNDDAAARYEQTALALCRSPFNARYLALGLEVNSYADRTSIEDYSYFVQKVYIPIYDAIKAIDPTIRVFVTFQLEQMKGLGNEWGFAPKLHWSLLDLYRGKLDLVAFTTYPEFVYADPSDIPHDYYSSIHGSLPDSLKSKPLAFVEMGWSDREGTAVTQTAQLAFLDRFLTLIQGMNVEYVNWVFLHDEHRNPVNPKLRLGLKDYDGSPRPIWQAWRSLKALPYLPLRP